VGEEAAQKCQPIQKLSEPMINIAKEDFLFLTLFQDIPVLMIIKSIFPSITLSNKMDKICSAYQEMTNLLKI